jgi:hypothetical protein
MRLGKDIWISILLIALGPPAAGADQQAQPAPPSPSEMRAQGPEEGQAPSSPWDSGSFLGAEGFTAGAAGQVRSYLLPSLELSERADSNYAVLSGRQRFEGINTLVGRLALLRAGKHSALTADYLGGGQIYDHHSELNGTIQQLGIVESYRGRRWGLQLDDRVTYLPESGFGYGGFGWGGGLGPDLGGAFGSNLSSVSPVFNPTSFLLTGRGSRITNVAIAQVEYLAGPRSMITLTGSYGLLDFRTPGFIDSRDALSLVGYSRKLTTRDYMGVSAGFGQFRLLHQGPAFKSNFFLLNYGRRITGRMAFEAGAGPQINLYKNPLAGSSTPVSWVAFSTLDYRARRGNLAISYSHYTSNGGGVLIGARTDHVQLGWNMRLARHWSGGVGPGYAHSRSLAQTTALHNQRAVNAAYVGASLSRNFGRYISMFLTYNLQTQRDRAIACVAGNCHTSVLRHVAGFGFDWHPRQITID